MLKNRIRSQVEVEQYMTELKEWLNHERDTPVEVMTDFFTNRLNIHSALTDMMQHCHLKHFITLNMRKNKKYTKNYFKPSSTAGIILSAIISLAVMKKNASALNNMSINAKKTIYQMMYSST